MSSSRFTKLTFASGLAVATSVPWMLASCATTEGESTPSNDASSRLEVGPEPESDAGAVPVDGGCDAGDPNCVTTEITCAQAEWCPVETNVSAFYSLVRVWGSGTNDVWATGSGATVIHWDGVAWAPTPVPTEGPVPLKETFRALWASGSNDVWIASASDMIFHSDGFKNGTATWVRTPNPIESPSDRTTLLAAWGTTADDVRFGGRSSFYLNGEYANQIVRKPSDAGIEWTRSVGLWTVNGFWGSSADDLWAVADNRPFGPQVGMTQHGTRTAGGDFAWKEIDSRTETILQGIWGTSATDIWAVGNNGTIRHFGPDPNAVEWAIVPSPTKQNLTAVWGSGPNDIWVVGESGTILHWDGLEWRSSLAAFALHRKKPHLYGIWGSGPSDVWIVGDDVALHFTGVKGGTK